jgi:hypothetical protein
MGATHVTLIRGVQMDKKKKEKKTAPILRAFLLNALTANERRVDGTCSTW